MTLYSVTLLSLYTRMRVLFTGIAASSQLEANEIALRCMANDSSAWRVDE